MIPTSPYEIYLLIDVHKNGKNHQICLNERIWKENTYYLEKLLEIILKLLNFCLWSLLCPIISDILSHLMEQVVWSSTTQLLCCLAWVGLGCVHQSHCCRWLSWTNQRADISLACFLFSCFDFVFLCFLVFVPSFCDMLIGKFWSLIYFEILY